MLKVWAFLFLAIILYYHHLNMIRNKRKHTGKWSTVRQIASIVFEIDI